MAVGALLAFHIGPDGIRRLDHAQRLLGEGTIGLERNPARGALPVFGEDETRLIRRDREMARRATRRGNCVQALARQARCVQLIDGHAAIRALPAELGT